MSAVAEYKARTRKAYRANTHIEIYPVSKGTFSVRARVGDKNKTWTGIDDPFKFEDAIDAAGDFLAEHVPE